MWMWMWNSLIMLDCWLVCMPPTYIHKASNLVLLFYCALNNAIFLLSVKDVSGRSQFKIAVYARW